MKISKFSSIVCHIEEDEVYIDVEFLEDFRKYDTFGMNYSGLLLGLGDNILLFDVKSCDYFTKKET